jgi:uncharacterized LabA/DUF88 family protein
MKAKMNFKKWLIDTILQIKSVPITEYVIFDGDQTSDKTFLMLLTTSKSTKFVWVQVGTILSKIMKLYCDDERVELIQPSSVGKEATDTQIAISIVDALHTIKTLHTVYIVSSDGDFIDVIVNISKLFPTKKFVLVNNQQHKSSKSATRALRNLNTTYPNCFSVKMKRM